MRPDDNTSRTSPGEEPDLDPAWNDTLRDALLSWYDPLARDLPWRQEADPYRVLVAETMLVQTTVAAVKAFYNRFLDRFPSPHHLADATEEELLRAWEGLGYYRRARNLQAAARIIVREHNGQVPQDGHLLRQLPGVGPYIAGAVRSFAFDLPAPILEANTQRVLARLLAWKPVVTRSASQRRLWEAAARLVPDRHPGRFNQALMDLGALLCTPTTPSCLLCPLASLCQAHLHGLQDSLPSQALKAPPSAVSEACALIEQEGRVLLLRRAPGQLWDGFWEFPTVHLTGPDPASRLHPRNSTPDLVQHVLLLTGLQVNIADQPAKSLRYVVTRYRVSLAAFRAQVAGSATRPGPGTDRVQWIARHDLESYPLASPYRRLARSLLSPAL